MTMPAYISFAGVGESSWPAPGVFADSTFTGFFVPADAAKMQALVDRILNITPDKSVRYEVLGENMFCTFMQIGKCYSGSAQTGYFPYREAMLVIPLLEWRKRHLLPRLVTWPAYMIPDEVIPTVTGREGWGYPKSIGSISVPADAGGDAPFSLSTMLFKELSNNCEGQKQTLFAINHENLEYGDRFGDLQSLGHLFREAMPATDSRIATALDGVTKSVMSALPDFTLTNVNLKQFRDVSETNNACYQSITSAPLVMTNFRGGRLISGDLSFFAQRCESHQIIEQFGLAAAAGQNAEVPVTLGIELSIDFEIRAGETVWQAGG